jgi:uncharacterized protein (DUF433 family)
MSTAINTLLISSPGVCGGRLRIDGTRITVNQIATLYKQGYSAEEIAEHYQHLTIAEHYQHLTMAQIYAALAYYHANQEEIEADLVAEGNETHGEAGTLPVSREDERWLEAFNELQRRLNLTPAKAAEWQDAIREARR